MSSSTNKKQKVNGPKNSKAASPAKSDNVAEVATILDTILSTQWMQNDLISKDIESMRDTALHMKNLNKTINKNINVAQSNSVGIFTLECESKIQLKNMDIMTKKIDSMALDISNVNKLVKDFSTNMETMVTKRVTELRQEFDDLRNEVRPQIVSPNDINFLKGLAQINERYNRLMPDVPFSEEHVYGEFLNTEHTITTSYGEFDEEEREFLMELLNEDDFDFSTSSPQMSMSVMDSLESILGLINELWPDMADPWIKTLIEDVITLTLTLCVSNSVSACTLAIAQFVRNRTGVPFHRNPYFKELLERARNLFAEMPQGPSEVFDSIQQFLDKYQELKRSPLVSGLYRLLCYAIMLNFVPKSVKKSCKSVLKSLEDDVYKTKFESTPDIFIGICEAVKFMCERGYQALELGSLQPLLHSETAYTEWMSEVESLKTNLAGYANDDVDELSEASFLGRLDSCIEKGVSIAKFASRISEFDKRRANAVVNECKRMRAQFQTMRFASSTRKAPFVTLLHGDTGIGKSTLTSMLVTYFAKLYALPEEDEYRYHHNGVSDYWDGFKTYMWCIIMDDVAYMNPNKAPNGDHSVTEIIQINNPMPFSPNQAKLEDKGMVACRPEFVVATTNTFNLNAHHYFSTPIAVLRRMPYITTPKVKPEYAKNNMLDPEVAMHQEGDFPDWWTFDVHKVIPYYMNGRQIARYEQIFTDLTLEEYLKWFQSASAAHRKAQTQVKDSAKHMKGISLCSTCNMPPQFCHCDCPPQMFNPDPGSTPVEIVVPRPPWYKVWWHKLFYSCGTNPDIEMCPVCGTSELQCACTCETCGSGARFCVCWRNNPGGSERMPSGLACRRCNRYFVFCWCKHWIDYFLVTRVFLPVGLWFFSGIVSATATFLLLIMKVPFGIAAILTFLFSFSVAKTVTLPIFHYFLWKLFWMRVRGQHPNFRRFYLYAAGIASLVYVYRKIMYPAAKVQGALNTKGKAPEPKEKERDNVWYKDDYALTSIDVSPMTSSWKAFSIDEVSSMIEKNCALIQFDNGRACRALNLCGHLWVFPRHCHSATSRNVAIITNPVNGGGVSENIYVQVPAIRYNAAKDLAFIELKHIPPGKDITQLFIQGDVKCSMNAMAVVREPEGHIRRIRIRNMQFQKDYAHDCFTEKMDLWAGYPDSMTKDGDCGSPYIGMTPRGPVIVGFHTLCNNITVAARSIIFDDLKDFLPKKVPNHQVYHAPEDLKEVTTLHHKANVRWVQGGFARVYGSFTGFRSKPKSSVCKTPICDEISSTFGWERNYTRPVMNSWKPWYIALEKMSVPITLFDQDHFDYGAQCYLREVLSMVGDQLDIVHVLDYFTALNGAEGVSYIDKINTNTSAGFPWRTSKKHFKEPVPPQRNLQEPFVFTPEIQNRVEKMIEMYEQGISCQPIFTAHLKDEPVTFEKAELGKTRVFAGAPVDFVIVVRMYYLSLVRLIQNNKIAFECACGTVAQSLEWGVLRSHLTRFGDDRMVAGDYSAFDKQMPPGAILAAFDILIGIAEEAGYSEVDLKVMRGIAIDIAYPTMDYNGTLMQFFGSNPSGHPLTVIINSLVNSLYVRMAYMQATRKLISNFRNDVALLTYGDDNAMGVREGVQFGHTDMQKQFEKIGIKYTMADKKAESVNFIHIDDVSFLKRKWVWDDDFEGYRCPLEMDSIHKMLTIWTASKTICKEEQLCAVVSSAVRELAFHGRQIFDLHVPKLRSIIESNPDWTTWITPSTFPSFDSLVNDWKVASEKLYNIEAFQTHTSSYPELELYVEKCKLPKSML